MRGQRVLVVDDESGLRTTLLRALSRNNYQVVTAQSASEAISLSKSGQGFDLALIDLRLPDMDGMELLSLLKSHS
ncbi:MAG: response regulator, partial [Bdellovibrionales bacterium]|nr:response regulator [Bdellovibrionales bacterium]